MYHCILLNYIKLSSYYICLIIPFEIEITLPVKHNNSKKLIEENASFIKNVLDFKFLNYIYLSLITISIEFKVKTRFYSIFITVYFIEQYVF